MKASKLDRREQKKKILPQNSRAEYSKKKDWLRVK